MADNDILDLLIVGGGINGAGIARDAAGRGLKVLLVEQGDLASATSSASSKLIHGGLRYLEHYEFRLVAEALAEREVLLGIAPHISWPLTFVLPHVPEMRPAWMIRAGLFLYDHLARRDRLPGSTAIDLRRHPAGAPLKPELTRGFTYADGWVDDARLVVLNAVDAAERGAVIRTRTRLVTARRTEGVWEAEFAPVPIAGPTTVEAARRTSRSALAPTYDVPQRGIETVRARILVNAAGPWVDDVRRLVTGSNAPARARLVKGSHVIVPRLYDGPHAYILQQPDKRVVFLLPYEHRFTLIGTTDVPHEGPPGPVTASPEEEAYLCTAASRFLKSAVTPDDVLWTFAGLRALHDDDADNPSAVTRDYVLELEVSEGEAPLLNIIGGKITTYRRLAEAALDKLAPHLPHAAKLSWTGTAALPGGAMAGGDFNAFLARLCGRYPGLPVPLLHRLARTYGTRAERILGDARSLADLGPDLGGGLSEREVGYLKSTEFAHTTDDILWRRTKLGLGGDRSTDERIAVALRRA